MSICQFPLFLCLLCYFSYSDIASITYVLGEIKGNCSVPGVASSFLSFLTFGLVLQKYHLVSFTSILYGPVF